MSLSKSETIISWVLRSIVGIILVQTLFFKFSASQESVYIFSTLGIEPVGRIGSGIAELIASILLFIPSMTVYGAILALGVISGAILAHLTKLGIVVLGDGGLLFGLALVVFFGSLGILFIQRKGIPFIGKSL